MAWNDELEGPARDFAGSDGSRTRCVAGPGTGKTFALMRRVQYLLEERSVPPDRILVVTLTRTAADDLRQSLLRLEVAGVEDVVASTLHSLCFSMLLQEAVLAITHRSPRLLAVFERNILLKDLPDDLGTFAEKSRLLKEFQAAWSALDGTPLGHATGSLPGNFQDALVRSLRWHRCMLVGELVPIARTYLAENPYAAALERFDHVLVDEYQDLNRADHGVLEQLGDAAIRRGGGLTIIGDDDQCIYVMLRNAHPRGIVEFEADIDVPLVDCRRCPTRIVQMAQSLIEHNPHRKKSALIPRESNPPGVVHNVMFETMEDEANRLAQFIHSRIQSGQVEPGEVLVLANWRVIAYRIRDLLLEMGNDAHSYFREESLDSPEARRALTLLTLLANPDDRVALRAYLALCSQTEERVAYRRIQAYAVEHGLTGLEVLRRLSERSLAIPHTNRAVRGYEALVATLEKLEPLSNEPAALIGALCPSGDEATCSLRKTADRALLDPDAGIDVGTLVAAIRTQIGVPEVPLDAPFVRLMSLHKSKGLTVKLVVIAGLVEGLVPCRPPQDLHGQALEEHEREQRRILFVGITRPAEELVLSRFQKIDAHSAHVSRATTGRWAGRGIKTTMSSPLLRELGPELPDVVRGDNWVY